MRLPAFLPIGFLLLGLSGCGYHTMGASTHLPPDVKTLAVPMFLTRTEAYHTETTMTDAVIHEFAARSGFRVTPEASESADAVLHGAILKEYVAPLTYNASTQQSSSFLITLVVSVTLNGRRVAPIPGYFQTTNEGAPGPSHSGTGDATDLNPESVRDAPGQSP